MEQLRHLVAAQLEQRASVREGVSVAMREMDIIKQRRQAEQQDLTLKPGVFKVGHNKSAIRIYREVRRIRSDFLSSITKLNLPFQISDGGFKII